MFWNNKEGGIVDKNYMQLLNRVNDLERRLWIVENPPKFEVRGDVSHEDRTGVVVGRKAVMNPDYHTLKVIDPTWSYKVLMNDNSQIEAFAEENLK